MSKKELIESALREAKDFSKAIRKYFYEVSEVRPLLEQDKELYELAHRVHIKTNDAIMIIIEDKNEAISRFENMLYNAILSWYDDSLTEYHGLDDEVFVERVCNLTGLSEAEYKSLITGYTEECSWNK